MFNNTIVSNVRSEQLAVARAAAKLKREKKADAIIARQKGKEKATEQREMQRQEWLSFMDNERAMIDKKVAQVRKAMGVHKNEDNPIEIHRLIEQWRFESLKRYHMKQV